MDPVLIAKVTRQVVPYLGGLLTLAGVLDAGQALQLQGSIVTIVDDVCGIVGPAMAIASLAMVIYRHFRPTNAIVRQVNEAAAVKP